MPNVPGVPGLSGAIVAWNTDLGWWIGRLPFEAFEAACGSAFQRAVPIRVQRPLSSRGPGAGIPRWRMSLLNAGV